MATYKQEVISIVEQNGEKGPFKLVTFKKKDGTTKERKVWGDLAKAFTAPGQYDATYDDTTHYLTAAKLLGAAPAGSVGKVGVTPAEHKRSREIQAQTAMKAAAAALAGKPVDEIVEAIPKVMKAFMDAADHIDVKPQADIEEVPF